MKILITGSTGFIGKALINRILSEESIEVIATGRRDISVLSDAVDISHPNLRYVQVANIEDTLEVVDEDDIDVLIQLAWPIPRKTTEKDWLTFGGSLEVLFKRASAAGIKKFINVGTVAEFESLYSKNNYGQIRAYTRHRLKSIDEKDILIWPFITNCYGEYESSTRLIKSIIEKSLEGEKVTLSPNQKYYDFVYVEDLAEALFRIALKGKPNRAYMITGETGELKVLLEKILKDFLKYNNYEIKDNPDFMEKLPLEMIASLSKQLEEDTGYSPRVSLKDGIENAYNFYKNQKLRFL